MAAQPPIGSAQLKARIREICARKVSVGWFEGNVYAASGIPVAFVAFLNENGGSRVLKNGNTIVLPARSPMALTMANEGNAIAKDLADSTQRAVRTGKIDESLNQFGAVTTARFKETVNDGGRGPGNAEATIHGMILGYDKDGQPVRAGSSPAKENRTFGQGKGFDKPLVDSGRMLNTLIYKVE